MKDGGTGPTSFSGRADRSLSTRPSKRSRRVRLYPLAILCKSCGAIEVIMQRSVMVESRMGAVAWGLWPTPRFPSPLVKPVVPISGTRLSDWLHRKAHDGRPLDAGVQR